MNRCHYCGEPAEIMDSMTDSSLPGINLNEPGYRDIWLCEVCAFERGVYLGNETRLRRIVTGEATRGEVAYVSAFAALIVLVSGFLLWADNAPRPGRDRTASTQWMSGAALESSVYQEVR